MVAGVAEMPNGLLELLIKEKGIKLKAVPQIIAALGMALLTALPIGIEYLLFRLGIGREKLKDPVFIVGHWRSGTTLVQYLMAQDKNFGNFDAVFNFAFNFYHVLGWLFRPLVKGSLSEHRPQDNMRLSVVDNVRFQIRNVIATLGEDELQFDRALQCQ